MGRKGKRQATDDLAGATGATSSTENISQAANKKQQKVKRRKKTAVASPNESNNDIDDAIDAVLAQSQSPTATQTSDIDDGDMECGGGDDEQQLRATVDTLTKQVRVQQNTINRLTNQVDLVVGVWDSQAMLVPSIYSTGSRRPRRGRRRRDYLLPGPTSMVRCARLPIPSARRPSKSRRPATFSATPHELCRPTVHQTASSAHVSYGQASSNSSSSRPRCSSKTRRPPLSKTQ